MENGVWQGKWKQLRGRIKQVWGRMTDDVFLVYSGEQDTINGRIQERAARARNMRPRIPRSRALH